MTTHNPSLPLRRTRAPFAVFGRMRPVRRTDRDHSFLTPTMPLHEALAIGLGCDAGATRGRRRAG